MEKEKRRRRRRSGEVEKKILFVIYISCEKRRDLEAALSVQRLFATKLTTETTKKTR